MSMRRARLGWILAWAAVLPLYAQFANNKPASLSPAGVQSGEQTAASGPGMRDPFGNRPADSTDAALKLRAETELVVIPVTVTDASNRFVLGLEKQDFRIFENGVEQTIKQFAGEDVPLSVGLIVDISGSMADKIDISREAVTDFLKTLTPHDEAFLVEFNDTARVTVGFTKQFETITHQLASADPNGLTALLDGVYAGLREMRLAVNTRKALIVISDGGDNNSRYTAAQINELVRQADVQVYSVGVYERFPFLVLTAEERSGPQLLAHLSQQTGGRVFSAAHAQELPSIATRIGIELRNQYVLAYTPKDQRRDGKYRSVEVKINQPASLPPLKARWRLGYYAPTD
jgi:Ca-activated chloride channel family protein